jgi:hypothetical protein
MKTREELKEQYARLLKDIEQTIVETMQSKNVSLISFVHNGDNSNYSVDRAYVDGDTDNEVAGVAILNKSNQVILFSDIPSDDELSDIFDGNPIGYKSDHLDKLLYKACDSYDNTKLLDEIYCPIDTIYCVLDSVLEVIENLETIEHYDD